MQAILKAPIDPKRERLVDAGLTTLLVLQGFTLLVAVPLAVGSAAGRVLLDACHLSFAVVCIGILTRRRAFQAALIASLALLVAAPLLSSRIGANLQLTATVQHEFIAFVAFAFNGVVTLLVARNVFAPGRVTKHRIRGAVLLYLNVAALFAIAYGAVAMNAGGAFAWPDGRPAGFAGASTLQYSYFSLVTITTTGYGDIVPVLPLARSLANLEAIFGQLYPATLLTRLVSLHLVHEREGATTEDRK